MKQTEKNWLIGAAALVLIGILVVVGAMGMSRWEFSAFSTGRYETSVVEIQDAFLNIDIRSDTEDIEFLSADDGTCRVVFYERENERHTASVRDGTLSIEVTDTGKWYESFSLFSFGSPRITIYLPQTAYAALSIENSTGDIVMPEDFTFESAGISGDTGDVDWSASAGSVRIELSTGDIRIHDVFAEQLALSVSTGRVDVSSAACEGDVSVGVSTGKTVLSGVSCKTLVSTGSTGDIMLENVIASEAISLKRSTGDVSLERCDAQELSIITDTGDVSGSLLSEKVFIVQSDTGSIDVPKTASGGRCEITTETGNIAIVVS